MSAEDMYVEHLEKIGALRNGHFVLTSGNHSSGYVNPDILYADPEESDYFSKIIAEAFAIFPIDVVMGPAQGANYLARDVARWLKKDRARPYSNNASTAVHAALTEKTSKKPLQFGFLNPDSVKGKKVLVVEDITTTAESTLATIAAAEMLGAKIAAVCILWCRSHQAFERLQELQIRLKAPVVIFIRRPLPLYSEAECVLCKDGVPINTDIGHGKEFLKRKGLSKADFARTYANR